MQAAILIGARYAALHLSWRGPRIVYSEDHWRVALLNTEIVASDAGILVRVGPLAAFVTTGHSEELQDA